MLTMTYPWLALIPAVFFGIIYYFNRRRAALVASILWLAYYPWELGMKNRILCSGECNIRIDLLILLPLLLIVSVAAIVTGLWSIFRKRNGG